MEQKKNSCLVLLLHKDAHEREIVNAFRHRADLLIDVEELETGYSRDIHGQLCVTNPISVGLQKWWHFVLSDNNVQLLHRGIREKK
jgi:hypothetical protein